MEDARSQKAENTEIHRLEAGTLTLTTFDGPELALFRIAERINPKRAFLFVSTVLGRHIPVDPVRHRAALATLADGVSAHLLAGPVFVMGFAETAVGIGAGVFDCLRNTVGDRDIGYLTTTRFSPALTRDWFTITESHSHAVDHFILAPDPGVLHYGPDATLVLVDDETTTGRTFAQLVAGLQAQGVEFGRVILVTLTDWSDGQAAAAVEGIFEQADVRSVSLQCGTWVWTSEPGATLPGLPGGCAACCAPWQPKSEQAFAAPRTGLAGVDPRQSGKDILTDMTRSGFEAPEKADRILVVGAGEHVWQPMLVAEEFCARGHYTRFITTTRSPILTGETIRHKVTFPDHYGQGFKMYMHNVVPSDWDRIVLFTETGVDGVPPALVDWLGRVDVIDGAGAVTVLSGAGGEP
ncbi:phosphoribosyltransferase domain-containing protein [Oceaniglobus ichthyenteri]|uniref:phosphoribosyltransferase domain-containing protein n=1 Tax=Oceaniglobus ichthyenteri TaxID=2136177 RepID=UPI000D38A9AE|nr:phosphoribosyltransferase domain-containing protein [Oceaniglobus ichthyenteri]